MMNVKPSKNDIYKEFSRKEAMSSLWDWQLDGVLKKHHHSSIAIVQIYLWLWVSITLSFRRFLSLKMGWVDMRRAMTLTRWRPKPRRRTTEGIGRVWEGWIDKLLELLVDKEKRNKWGPVEYDFWVRHGTRSSRTDVSSSTYPRACAHWRPSTPAGD